MSGESAVVSAHFLAVGSALQDVTTTEASQLFTYLCECFLDFCEDDQKLPRLPDVNNEAIQRSRAKLEALVDLRSTPVLVRHIWTAGLPCVAASLLSMADDPHDANSSKPTMKSLRSIFSAAPAPMVLSILQSHLSLVRPAGDHSTGSAWATVPGMHLAATILCDRFIANGSPGIRQLSAEVQASGDINGPEQASDLADKFARELMSIPEKSAGLQLPHLQPASFVHGLMKATLAAAESRQAAQEAVTRPSQLLGNEARPLQATQNVGAQQQGASTVLRALLARAVRRGHTEHIAVSLWTFEKSFKIQSDALTAKGPVAMALAACRDPRTAGQLLQALLRTADTDPREDALAALSIAVAGCGIESSEVRLLIEENLILKAVLPPSALQLLISLIASLESRGTAAVSILRATTTACQVWSSDEAINGLPAPRQAYMSAALILCLRHLTQAQLQGSGEFCKNIYTGISARLGSAEEPIRRQGMRVGNAYAATLQPDCALFVGVQPFELLPTETWHTDCIVGSACGIHEDSGRAQASSSPRVGAVGSNSNEADASQTIPEANGAHHPEKPSGKGHPVEESEVETATDSDDSLEPYEMNEDPPDPCIDGQRPLQLRDVAERLLKSEEPNILLQGLRAAPLLIEAAPDELANFAGILATNLLCCQPPDWDDLRQGPVGDRPEVMRARALTELLVRTPREGGLALAGHFLSPHMNLHQRLLILDAMSSAATTMSTPPPRHRLTAGEEIGDGKTRRWGERSLALQGESRPRTFRNRFPEVAMEWVAALLRHCGEDRHGVDIFGRDALLLARLLAALGVFASATAPTLQTVHVAAASLALLQEPAVCGHAQPVVRRASLACAAEILSALPPSLLDGALANGRNAADAALLEGLRWLSEWAQHAAIVDNDRQVRQLAAGCISLQASLGRKALDAASASEELPQSMADLKPSELIGHPNRAKLRLDSIRLS